MPLAESDFRREIPRTCLRWWPWLGKNLGKVPPRSHADGGCRRDGNLSLREPPIRHQDSFTRCSRAKKNMSRGKRAEGKSTVPSWRMALRGGAIKR